MTSIATGPARILEEAREQAAAACARSSVRVVPVDSSAAARQVVEVLDAVWGPGPVSLPVHLVRAMADTGSYVVGLHDLETGVILGASLAFFTAPPDRVLHSHITGILPGNRGRHVGTAVKLDQRSWALDRGQQGITWTYDPLLSRNAHFNLTRLGARASSYVSNFYGLMGDLVNQQGDTDRIHVTWDIERPWDPSWQPVEPTAERLRLLEVGHRMEPVSHAMDPDAREVSIGVPRDIEVIRTETPDLAQWWRRALREAISPRLEEGFVVSGFTSDSEYLLVRP